MHTHHAYCVCRHKSRHGPLATATMAMHRRGVTAVDLEMGLLRMSALGQGKKRVLFYSCVTDTVCSEDFKMKTGLQYE